VTAEIISIDTHYKGKKLMLTVVLDISKSTCRYVKHDTHCESIQPRKFAFYMLMNAIHDYKSGGFFNTNVVTISGITFYFKGQRGTIKAPEVYDYYRRCTIL